MVMEKRGVIEPDEEQPSPPSPPAGTKQAQAPIFPPEPEYLPDRLAARFRRPQGPTNQPRE